MSVTAGFVKAILQIVEVRLQIVEVRLQLVGARIQLVEARLQLIVARLQLVVARLQLVGARLQLIETSLLLISHLAHNYKEKSHRRSPDTVWRNKPQDTCPRGLLSDFHLSTARTGACLDI